MENTKPAISAAEMERMMKVQEVILRAVAGKMKWWEGKRHDNATKLTLRRRIFLLIAAVSGAGVFPIQY